MGVIKFIKNFCHETKSIYNGISVAAHIVADELATFSFDTKVKSFKNMAECSRISKNAIENLVPKELWKDIHLKSLNKIESRYIQIKKYILEEKVAALNLDKNEIFKKLEEYENEITNIYNNIHDEYIDPRIANEYILKQDEIITKQLEKLMKKNNFQYRDKKKIGYWKKKIMELEDEIWQSEHNNKTKEDKFIKINDIPKGKCLKKVSPEAIEKLRKLLN